jgi:hypothetical protein
MRSSLSSRRCGLDLVHRATGVPVDDPGVVELEQ